MKKRNLKLIAFLLALTVLCGCASPAEFYEEVSNGTFSVGDTVRDMRKSAEKKGFFSGISDTLSGLLGGAEGDPYAQAAKDRAEKIVPFDEMEYVRPDIEKLEEHVRTAEDALDEGKMRVTEIIELLDPCFDDYYEFDTMYCLANIRNCIDLKNEKYVAEYEWCGEQESVVLDLIDELYYACGGSRYAKKLERKYFWEGFAEEYANEEDSIYTDEMVDLMQQESALISEYRDIIAEQTVEIDGRDMTLDEALDVRLAELEAAYTAVMQDNSNDNIYAYYDAYDSYFQVLTDFYEKYNQLEGDIFVQLVKLRKEMAEEAGYDSYEQMQYEFTYERDYSPEDADGFIKDVEKYIIPLYEELQAEFAEQQEQESASPVETDTSEQGLKNCLSAVVEKMGGTFPESYDFMTEYRLYDFSNGPNKTPMSFQTYLENYEAPFLLISPSGTYNDILTAVHEFGHYTDSFGSYGASETLDLAECFSQGLELLSLDMLSDVVGEETVDRMGAYKVMDILGVYQQQCAFAEFEREVYSLPEDEVTLDRINSIFLEVAERFKFQTEGQEDYISKCWIDIPHFFEQALYVISYPVSNIVSLQFYGLEQETEGEGVAKYNDMLHHSSGDLLETLEEYGMEDPFESDAVKQAAKTIKLLAKKYL